MTNIRQNFWKLFLLVAFLCFTASGAQAQDDKAFTQYRQSLMNAQVVSFKMISHILKNKTPYKNHIATHAKIMELTATLYADAFKKEITAGKTDSKPEIWKDWAKFAAAAKAQEQESAKLADVAQYGDAAAIGAQVKKVGMSCGSCHKLFRKPKEESYKRR